MTLECRPNQGKIWVKKSWATPAALMSLEQGQQITLLLSPWSTTTMTESNLWELGNPMVRSTKMEKNGRVD